MAFNVQQVAGRILNWVGAVLLALPLSSNTFSQEASTVSMNTVEHQQLMQLLQAIEPYHPRTDVTGTATLAGSTTMTILGQNWSERFKLFHKDVVFTRGVDGGDAALRSLAKDPNVIAGISRSLTDKEIADLKAGACKDPMIFIVALDPMAVYVHKDNPLQSLTPEQMQKLFGAGSDGKPKVSKWGELGVQGAMAEQPIRIHHRSSISGTRNFIKTSILGGLELAEPAQTHESNTNICTAISKDPNGIAMCGFGDGNEGVRPLALELNNQRIEANESSFLAGKYPIVRPLSLILDKSLLAKDNGLREAIIRYILSRDGQLEAIRAGFYPLDPNFLRQEIAQLTGTQLR
ncbi:MAG: substrate-binding domain-containing protein [Pirellulaceae bacterium]|nr:substrate-binding domain-containing protein [Pirellulaceae bacterium]